MSYLRATSGLHIVHMCHPIEVFVKNVGLDTLSSDVEKHTYMYSCLGKVTHESASNSFYVGNISIFIDTQLMGYLFNIYVLFSCIIL